MLFQRKLTMLGTVPAAGLLSVAAMMTLALPLAGAGTADVAGTDEVPLLAWPDMASTDWDSPITPFNVPITAAPTWLAMGCRVAPSDSTSTPMAAVSDCSLWELVSGLGSCFVCLNPKLLILKTLLGKAAKIGGCLLCLERILDEASDLLNGNETNIMACIRAFRQLL